MYQDNSANNKRIAKNTLLLYVRMLLTMTVSLYTSRVVLDALGVNDFGIYNVVGGFVSMFAVVSGAMTTASQRFLSFEIGKGFSGRVHDVFSTTVMIHIGLALIILLLGETIGVWFLNKHMNFPVDRYYAANWVFQFSLITFLINVISVPYNAAIVAYERMKAFAYVSIIEVLLKLIIVYLIIISPIDRLILYAALLSIVAITIRFIYGVYCRRNFHECGFDWKWDKQLGKQIASFVSWNLIGSASSIAKGQGINVVLNMFFGAIVNAARGIAYQVFNAISGFVGNFQLAMNPQIVKSYAANEKTEMFKLVFRGSRLSYLLMLTFVVPVFLEAPYLLNLWLVEVPESTILFLRLVLLTALVDSLSGTLITSMHASGKVRDYQIVVGGISLLTLPIVYITLKMGVEAYWALVIDLSMSILLHFMRVILLKHSIGFPMLTYLKSVTFKVSMISVLAIIIPVASYLIIPVCFLSFIVICLICVISTSVCSYIWGLEIKEKLFVMNKAKMVISKLK